MRRLLLTLLLNVLAVWVATSLLDGVDSDGRARTIVLAGVVLGCLNLVLRPALVVVALPIVLLTFGVGLVLVNAFLLGLTSWLVPGFAVHGAGSAILGALVVSVVNLALGATLRPARRAARS